MTAAHADQIVDGSMIVSIQSSVTAVTAPTLTQSLGQGWIIMPDGTVRSL
jgi:hypothetical protein